jgi:dTDP-4-amino-4,6-dideoxygalactose transaminase
MTDESFLPFARPSITEREIDAVVGVLRSGWLTTGPTAKEFERAFAERVGSRHAIGLNSATAALHLALEATGVGPGDEVIVPTWTFTASAEVAVYLGATPVLVDVDPITLNAGPQAVAGAVTDRTKAIMAVHLAGLPMAIEDLLPMAGERGIAVIEDAAHAFPSPIAALGGRLAGTVGAAGAYSFYATKTITTGEGGMLVTDDDAIARRARMMALHGISRDAWDRYAESGSWYYEVAEAGYKYNLTDLAAALGLVQLSRADELLAERVALARRYRDRIGSSPIRELVELPADGPGHAWHLFILRLRLDRLAVDRDEVIRRLARAGIGTSVHFIPLHLHPYYRDRLGARPEHFPVATAEYRRVISLPIWPGMGHDAVDRVVAALEEILADSAAAFESGA